MATCVHPHASSQAESASKSTVIVPKVRISWLQPPCPSGVNTQATTVFLWTSKPAHRSYMMCITTSVGRRHGGHGHLKRQILTCVLKGNSWRCLQVSGSDCWSGSGHHYQKRPRGQPRSCGCSTFSWVVVTTGHEDCWGTALRSATVL